jgi:hypothetical protein
VRREIALWDVDGSYVDLDAFAASGEPGGGEFPLSSCRQIREVTEIIAPG